MQNYFSDIGALWEAALDRYEQITGLKVQLLESANTIDAVLAQVEDKGAYLENRRHDRSAIDKVRSVVKESLEPVLILGEVVVHATKLVFPPVEAIFAAAKYLIGVANTVSAGYDKVASFFQDLSSYLHQLGTLEHKIPPIPQLQVAITDVFASILVLCGTCAKYFKTKRIAIALRSLVRSNNDDLAVAFSEFQRMVQRERDVVAKATLAGVVQLQADTSHINANVSRGLALSQGAQFDTRELTIRTSTMHRMMETRRDAVDRKQIMSWFTNLDFHDKQRETFAKHEDGTNQWLTDTAAFQKWAFGSDNTMLWCPGIPGAGKTVMMSTVIDYLFSQTDRSSAAIAYVYCNYKDPGTHSETQLLSSITKQILEQTRVVPPCVLRHWEKYIEAKRYPTTEERVALIGEMCRPLGRSYILVDALDECPETNRERFLHMLRKLQCFTRLLVTSRPHLLLNKEFSNAHRIDIVAKSHDIQRYTESQVAARRRLSDFVSESPALKTSIVNKLSQNAAGMFLLCDLQINRLCECCTVSQVFESLERLPARLGELYDEAFDRICGQAENDKIAAQRAISYLSVAKRPLTVDELRHALSVRSGDTDLDEYNLPLTRILLNISAGLIRVDDETNTAALVHHTLQEYLDEHCDRLIQDPEIELAIACLTYLSFETLASGSCINSTDLNNRLEKLPFLDYASHHWGLHATKLRRHEHLALLGLFLEDGAKVVSSLQILYVARSKTRGQRVDFPTRRSPLHILAYWGLTQMLEYDSYSGSQVNDQDSLGWTALHIAAQQGQIDTVRLLLSKNALVDATTNRGESALIWAARNGHENIFVLLQQAGASMEARDLEGWTALDWAAIRGQSAVVRSILSHKRAIFFDSEDVSKALILAAEAGNDETLQLLLRHGAEIDFRDADGSTALMWAVPEGHEDVAASLLSNGANAKARDMYSNCPLHWATPFERIAKLLIEAGAEIDAKNCYGQTALDWCAQDGKLAVSRVLLENGANTNSQDRFGFTALHAAALKGHESMVRLLIVNGADCNLKDMHGWTALHASAIRQHIGVTNFLKDITQDSARIVLWVAARHNDQDASRRHLLDHVAEKKSEGSTAITGLRWAVSDGRLERVRAILDNGASIDAEDVGGFTALTIGAFMDREAEVQLLMDYGADANKRERNGRTALHVASELGHLGVVKCLVEHGADMDAEVFSWTSLLLAARNAHAEVVHYLATEGADVQAKDYHMRSAMHWAAMHGSLLELRTLIYHGADFDATDRWGRTPLMWAVENYQSAAAELLLKGGAAPSRKAEDGSTVLHVVAFTGDEQLARTLMTHVTDTQEETSDGFSALQIALGMGNLELVELFTASVTDPSVKESDTSLDAKANVVAIRELDIGFDDGGDEDNDDSVQRCIPSLSRRVQRMVLQ